MSVSRKATIASISSELSWGRDAERLDDRAVEFVDGKHVAAAAIQLDHLAQREHVAVVKVRRGERHVAERRDFERALDPKALVHDGAIELGDRSAAGKSRRVNESGPNASVAPTPRSLSVGRTPMLLKPLSMTLPSRLRTGPFGGEATRRTEASVSSCARGSSSSGCVGGAAGAVVEEMGTEEGEPADVVRRLIRPGVQGRVGRRGVLTAKAVPGRVVGDERCLVELDRNPEEEREVVLDQRELVFGKVIVLRRVLSTRVLVPSAFTRISFLESHHLS